MLREPDSTVFGADALFDVLPIGLVLLDADLRLVRINHALTSLAGLPLGDQRGSRLGELWPAAEAAEQAGRQVLASGEPAACELDPVRAGGGRCVVRVFPIDDPRSEARLGLAVVELPARSRIELWVARQREVLDAIAAGALLGDVLELVVRMLQADVGGTASILVMDEDGRARHAAAPDLPAAYRNAIDGLEVGPSAGSCGTAMYRRQRVVVEDIATDPLWERFRDAALPFGLRACWSSPILSCDGTVIGSFAIYRHHPSRPSPDEIAVIEAATSLAGIAIERSRTDAALRRREARESSLRRVATAVAGAATLLDVASLVAAEAVQLLDASVCAVVRYDGDDALVVARGGEPDVPGPQLGDRYPVDAQTVIGDVFRSRRTARRERWPGADELGRLLRANGYTGSAGAPIMVDGRLWGAVLAWSRGPGTLPRGVEAELDRFAELAGMAIANAAARSLLADQAQRDPLTGLSNHRVFQERLRAAVRSARISHEPLSLVLFDVDGFKQVNDTLGHQRGDELLADIAGLLGEVSRSGETLARLGGDEFALLLPGSSAEAAERVAERLRASVAAAPGTTTLSAGVCDVRHASCADELFRLADGALYWAKGHGRNVVVRYDPDTIADLSAGERAERLARSQLVRALRTLAQAVDASQEPGGCHSERVASLARALAELRGWPSTRAALLHEAALLHDVGQLGVGTEGLRRPGPLSVSERQGVRAHTAVGARLVREVLGADQADWILHHHERADGHGYPDGLAAAQLTEGAGLLALAEAWDAMTSERPFRAALRADEALAECRRLRGSQFVPAAVDALLELHA